jgi:lysophospholipase L1-like esterase
MKRIIFILLLLPSVMLAQNLMIQEKVKFLALGDSYTIGQSVAVSERWPVQLIDSLKKRGLTCYDPKIIATTGWRTDNLKSAIINANLANDYNLVSLLIGVNNYYQGKSVESYAPEFEELLNMAIKLAGNNKSHVFVVSIPDYGYTPFGQSNQETISKGIDAFNAVNKSITEKYGITYFNITEISRRGLQEPSLVASDGLHPSGKMYAEWVELILSSATVSDSQGENDGGTVTGVMDERLGISIYPNPFNTELILENIPAHEPNLTFTLTDNRGVACINKILSVSEGKAYVDTASLSAGEYVFQLAAKDHLLKKGKILKNKFN